MLVLGVEEVMRLLVYLLVFVFGEAVSSTEDVDVIW